MITLTPLVKSLATLRARMAEALADELAQTRAEQSATGDCSR